MQLVPARHAQSRTLRNALSAGKTFGWRYEINGSAPHAVSRGASVLDERQLFRYRLIHHVRQYFPARPSFHPRFSIGNSTCAARLLPMPPWPQSLTAA